MKLIVKLSNRPGALCDFLLAFHNIQLTYIQSAGEAVNGEQTFYLDMIADDETSKVIGGMLCDTDPDDFKVVESFEQPKGYHVQI